MIITSMFRGDRWIAESRPSQSVDLGILRDSRTVGAEVRTIDFFEVEDDEQYVNSRLVKQSQARRPGNHNLLTSRRIFQLYSIQFFNTGVYGGLYTRLSKLSWHFQKHRIHSFRRFQHDLTVAWTCYVTETEYSPRFHEIPRISISWIDGFSSSYKHFHGVPTALRFD